MRARFRTLFPVVVSRNDRAKTDKREVTVRRGASVLHRPRRGMMRPCRPPHHRRSHARPSPGRRIGVASPPRPHRPAVASLVRAGRAPATRPPRRCRVAVATPPRGRPIPVASAAKPRQRLNFLNIRAWSGRPAPLTRPAPNGASSPASRRSPPPHAAAAVRAIEHVVPVARPLLAPRERTAAGGAGLGGQMRLLVRHARPTPRRGKTPQRVGTGTSPE